MFKLKRTIALVACLIAISTIQVSAYETAYDLTDCGYATKEEVNLVNNDLNEIETDKGEVIDEVQLGETVINDAPVLRYPYDQLPTSPGAAMSLSGNTPYHTGTYYMTAGSAGYVKLTPGQSYNVSAYTTGSSDTYIYVYSNAACTNLVTSNDDGGHGTNAKVCFYASAGTSYYIKIRLYSSSSSGTYSFTLHRGTPTSRSEKQDLFSTYNSSNYMTYNNCYTYALGYYTNPITGSRFRPNGQNPGEMSGHSITANDLINATTAKAAIESAMTYDFNYFGGSWASISASAQPRAGYYKVALVLAPGVDYHWYRQLPNGQWGHKPGSTNARNTDFSNYIIYYPSSCDRNGTAIGAPNYTEVLGFYEIKTPTASRSASPEVSTESRKMIVTEEKTYPVNKNITMEDVTTLTTETSYDCAMSILGEAHGYYGSGMIGSYYKLVDGTEIIVYFTDGHIDQVRTVPKEGKYTVIVG